MDKVVILKEWYLALQNQPAELRAEVMDAIMQYGLLGEQPGGLSPFAAGMFALIRPQMDKMQESYRAKSRGRAEAGRKGNAARWQRGGRADEEPPHDDNGTTGDGAENHETDGGSDETDEAGAQNASQKSQSIANIANATVATKASQKSRAVAKHRNKIKENKINIEKETTGVVSLSNKPPGGEKPRVIKPSDVHTYENMLEFGLDDFCLHWISYWNRRARLYESGLPQIRFDEEESLQVYESEYFKKLCRNVEQAAYDLGPKWADDFTAAIELCNQTPFLRGEGPNGWKASFDWLFGSSENIRKVINGYYEGKQNGNKNRPAGKASTNLLTDQQADSIVAAASAFKI